MTTATVGGTTADDVSPLAHHPLPTGRADSASDVDIVDVVGGAHEHAIDALVTLHRSLFPDYEFVAAEIVADANAQPERDSLVVHQWLVRSVGLPAGLILFDTNVARRVAVIHFLGIERPYRGVRIDGERLATWLCHRVRDTLAAELAERSPWGAPLGVFGESSDRHVRRWLGAGFRTTDLPYAEPVAGRHWRARHDFSMRPMNLLWLPMRRIEDPPIVPGAAGAAAFLIDHYALPLDHRCVVAATGDQRTHRGARR